MSGLKSLIYLIASEPFLVSIRSLSRLVFRYLNFSWIIYDFSWRVSRSDSYYLWNQVSLAESAALPGKVGVLSSPFSL